MAGPESKPSDDEAQTPAGHSADDEGEGQVAVPTEGGAAAAESEAHPS